FRRSAKARGSTWKFRVRIGPGPEGRKFRPGGGGKEKETGTDPVSPTTRPRVFSCSLASYPFLGSRTGSVACVINGWIIPRVSSYLVPRPAAGSGRTQLAVQLAQQGLGVDRLGEPAIDPLGPLRHQELGRRRPGHGKNLQAGQRRLLPHDL